MKGFPGRKDNIILAAIDIISENGIQGLSTKNIAARQGISESLLYRHFNSIDDVLAAVLESFCRYDMMIINTVEKRDLSYKEKILACLTPFLELYDSYPAFASIVLYYETLLHYDHTRQIIIDTIERREGFIKRTIERAQSEGEMKNNFTASEMTDIISGIINNKIFKWRMSGCHFNLKDDILATIKKVLDMA
jgi:AcrR family transcriptional regulator